MKFKGTKEKWRSVYDKNTDEYAIYSKNGDFIAVTISATEEDEANALLISKSPEMYEEDVLTISELEDILKVLDRGDIAFKLRMIVERKKQLIKEATEI